MKKYSVMLEGRDFLLEIGGSVKKYGFFTTRYVEAENPEEAEMKAVQLVRTDQSLQQAVRNEGSSPAIHLSSFLELRSFDGVRPPGRGYSFFPEDSQ
jgi:hypothetical protein